MLSKKEFQKKKEKKKAFQGWRCSSAVSTLASVPKAADSIPTTTKKGISAGSPSQVAEHLPSTFEFDPQTRRNRKEPQKTQKYFFYWSMFAIHNYIHLGQLAIHITNFGSKGIPLSTNRDLVSVQKTNMGKPEDDQALKP